MYEVGQMVMWNRWRDTVGTQAVVLVSRSSCGPITFGEYSFSSWDALFPNGKVRSVNEREFLCNPAGIHAEP